MEDRRIPELLPPCSRSTRDGRRGAGPRSAAPTTNTQEVEFTINWENCDELQEGSTIEGTGTLVSATVENVRRNGVAVARNSSLAVGTATDQAGNTYSWSYDNRFHAMSSADDPSSFTGTMVDEFLLAGDGPEHLHTASSPTSPGSARSTRRSTSSNGPFGDPIQFGPQAPSPPV